MSASPLSILQISINGLRPNLLNLVDYVRRHNISVAAIQETLCTAGSMPTTPAGFTIIRCDRPGNRGKGGGLAFVIHDSVCFRAADLRPLPVRYIHLEQPGVTLCSGESETTVVNIYSPPVSSYSMKHQLSIQQTSIFAFY